MVFNFLCLMHVSEVRFWFPRLFRGECQRKMKKIFKTEPSFNYFCFMIMSVHGFVDKKKICFRDYIFTNSVYSLWVTSFHICMFFLPCSWVCQNKFFCLCLFHFNFCSYACSDLSG